MKGSLLGKESTESEILDSLLSNNCVYKDYTDESLLLSEVSKLLKREWSLAGIKEEWSSVLGL